MKAPQTLRRPANWQDFESLCKRLWGEIWNCPEIQKNGRLGQEQSGVDIFGIPFNDDSYYGIQCKGKSEYNDNQYLHPQFTEKEIDDEIEKAKLFSPPLKKLYLATTALNDAKIQTFVREKNVEHKKNNLFEVHIFCWESIVDLIDENKQTHDYYLKSQNYKTNKSVSVTFHDGSTEITCTPKFKQTVTFYTQTITSENTLLLNPALMNAIKKHQQITDMLIDNSSFEVMVNHSFCNFYILISNTGTEPIEEYKVLLDFDGEIKELADTNEENTGLTALLIHSKIIPTTYLYTKSLNGKLIPRKSILVGDDTFKSEDIFLKPVPKESKIVIKWKLISKNFKDEGELVINVIPKIMTKREEILVNDPLLVRRVHSEIEDFIEKKKNIVQN
jgi:hypothetical protein